EKFHYDDSGLFRIFRLKTFEGFIDHEDLLIRGAFGQFDLRDVNPNQVATALEPRFAPRVLDQNSPHRFGRCAKEMRAILPGPLAIANKPQPGFMHKCSSLQGLPGGFLSHPCCRETAELVIDEWQKIFRRARLPATDCLQHLCDVTHLTPGERPS